MANTYDTNLILQSIASAITNAATSDPNLLAKLQAIADAITNGGGGGSVTASNVSVVPTSPFVSTNLQNLSVEEANAITANAGDITTINTALGNTSISGIGDGSVTGAIATNNGNINTINTALGNTSISGIGDGSVTGAISTLNSSIGTLSNTVATKVGAWTSINSATVGNAVTVNVSAYSEILFVFNPTAPSRGYMVSGVIPTSFLQINDTFSYGAGGTLNSTTPNGIRCTAQYISQNTFSFLHAMYDGANNTNAVMYIYAR